MGTWKLIPYSGCSVKDIEDDLNFIVRQGPGAGMAPLDNLSTDYGLLDGALFQRTRAKGRMLTLFGTMVATSVAHLHTRRRDFINAVKPDRVYPQEPVVIQYTGGGETLQASAYYDGGLEFTRGDVFNEIDIGLRFYCPDPYWEETTSTSTSMEPQTTFSASNLVQRDSDGNWSDICGGDPPNGAILGMVYDSVGNLYISGGFDDTVDSVSVDGFAKYDGAAWSNLGLTATNEIPYDVTIRDNGNLILGGAFTTAGGSNVNSRLIEYDGSNWAPISGCVAGTILTIESAENTIYIGGLFSWAGGSQVNQLANWDGANWYGLDDGISESGVETNRVEDIAYGKDGKLYVTGQFDLIGGSAGTTASNVGRWNRSSSAWETIGNVGSGIGTAIDIGLDGLIYLGGRFELGDSASVNGTAYWNGTTWVGMSGGVASDLSIKDFDDVHVDSDTGEVYYAGYFADIGNIDSPPDSVVKWNGSEWSTLGINLPGNAYVHSVATASGAELTLGYNTAGTASAANVTVITNGGTAKTYPVFTATGPGEMYHLINYSTDQKIFFDLALNAGETVTLDLRQGNKTFVSSTRGNLLGKIRPTSNLAAWYLTPGTNNVSLYISGGAASATMDHTDRYWSFDS